MMKTKIIICTVLFLAAASLGLAVPAKEPKKPTYPAVTASPLPPSLSTPAVPPSSATAVPPSSGTPGVSPSLDSLTQSFKAAGAPDAFADDIGKILGSITPACQAALFSIVLSPEFLKCIPIPSLIPLIPVVTDPTLLPKVIADPKNNYKLVEDPFIQFATAFCPAPKCSDDGVSKAIQTISTGCKEDLDKKNSLVTLIFGVTVFYSPIHDITCFKSKDSNKFCWDESILTVISLPKSPFKKLVDGGIIDSIAVADPPKVCTKCNKNIINTFFNFMKKNDLASKILAGLGVTQEKIDLLTVGVAVKCGLSFEDGKVVP